MGGGAACFCTYFGSNLVAALAGLQMNYLTHFSKGLEKGEMDKRKITASVLQKMGEMGAAAFFEDALAGDHFHANYALLCRR